MSRRAAKKTVRVPQVIGIYGPLLSESFHRAIAGILGHLDKQGEFQIRDFRMADTSSTENYTSPPWQGRADAVVVSFGRPDGMSDAATADWVLSGGVPAVSLAADWRDPRIPTIGNDQQAIGALAARHLQSCGCQSFLFVGYSLSTGSATRGEAFRAALQASGRPVVLHSMHEILLGSPDDEEAVLRDEVLLAHLRTLPKPLGVWALNDQFASAVYLLCEKLRLMIPDHVRVLGVDDLVIARMLRPMLSSIRTPSEAIGRRALAVLHVLLQGQPVTTPIIAVGGAELVPRASTEAKQAGDNKMEAARAYIAQHACAGVSVKEVAQVMDLTRRTLERSFRQFAGHSPGHEIHLVRLARAQELLRQPNISISRISAMVGFAETASFSKFFHKLEGMSPRAYRARSEPATRTAGRPKRPAGSPRRGAKRSVRSSG
jgi:LacI family transcriptional regulator